MRLFSPDLFRNIGIGFAMGALLIAVTTADQWGGGIAPPAQAAQARMMPAPSAEFVIAAERP